MATRAATPTSKSSRTPSSPTGAGAPPVTLDPRVERSRAAICAAALDELGEVGYGAMCIESIARRAGVGKATIYRHWAGKLDLIESALLMLKTDHAAPPDGTTSERLVALLTVIARFLSEPPASRCLPAIVSAAQYDESVRSFHRRFSRERRQVIVDVLEDGIAAGELDPGIDIELTIDLLVGPLFYRTLVTHTPATDVDVETLVATVLGRG